jgi:hypothetical protein
VQIRDEIDVGAKCNVDPNETRIVKFHVAATGVHDNLIVCKRLKDHPMNPAVVFFANYERSFMFDVGGIDFGHHNGDAVDDGIILIAAHTPKMVASKGYVALADRAGKNVEKVHPRGNVLLDHNTPKADRRNS